MSATKEPAQSPRPAEICKALLAALDAADGRRRKRKRDQTPDSIGLSIKRTLLEHAVQDDPPPDAFDEWLLNYPMKHAEPESLGAVSAMARAVLEEWRLAHSLEEFRIWLERGAPSDDAKDEKPRERSAAVTKKMNPSSDQPLIAAAAVVLAGGKSSRMGRPKSLLLFGGEPLIVHIVRALKRMFAEIVIVAAPDQELPDLSALLVRDEVAYQGPVGGIYYGLKAASGNFCFVTSCDVPFLNPSLISHLTSLISNYDLVVPFWEDRFQPLHAVYSTNVLPLLKEQLDRGELRPIYLFDKVKTYKIEEDVIRRFDPEGLSFFNMNTPDDYERALQRWNKLRSSASRTEDELVSCTVELFGMARLLAKTKMVDLALPQEATLSDVFSELAEKLPALVGRVINLEKNNLISGCACNVNGLDFVRNPAAKVKAGDRILILSADAGG
jgi:molybdopterin-guanine dinucleotide biosynthesis protein A